MGLTTVYCVCYADVYESRMHVCGERPNRLMGAVMLAGGDTFPYCAAQRIVDTFEYTYLRDCSPDQANPLPCAYYKKYKFLNPCIYFCCQEMPQDVLFYFKRKKKIKFSSEASK